MLGGALFCYGSSMKNMLNLKDKHIKGFLLLTLSMLRAFASALNLEELLNVTCQSKLIAQKITL